MNQVIRQGVKTKVLMLSATPVNNRFNDLRNQLALAYEGDSENLNKKLRTSKTVEEVFRNAQASATKEKRSSIKKTLRGSQSSERFFGRPGNRRLNARRSSLPLPPHQR